MKRTLLPPTFLLIALIGVLLLHILLPVYRFSHLGWRLLGLLPLAIGIWLNLAADRDFKTQQTTVKPFQESRVLLTGGVFRLTRNPMYVGFIAILLGVMLLLGSVGPVILIALFALFLDRHFICAEEQMLAQTFGDQWKEYRSRVRRWI